MKKILSNKLWMNVLIADLISNFGDVLFYLALMNYVVLLPDAKYAISMITIAETLPPLAAVLMGYLADKTKRKVSKIIATQLFRVILYVIIGGVLGFAPALWIVLVIVVLQFFGTLSAFYENSLYMPVSVAIISDELREESIAFKQTTFSIMNIVFKSISAVLIVMLSYQQLAFINAVTYGLSAVIMMCISKGLNTVLLKESKKEVSKEVLKTPEMTVHESKEKVSFLTSFKQSGKLLFSELKQDTEVLMTLLLAPFINGIFSVTHPLYILSLSQNNHFVIYNVSTTLAFVSILATVCSILGGVMSMTVLKKLTVRAVVTAILASLFLIFGGIYFSHIYIFLIGEGLMTVFIAALQPKLNARVMNTLPKENLGMLFGWITTYGQSGTLIISVLFSIVVTFLSAQNIALVCAALLVLLLVGYVSVTSQKKKA